MLTFEYSAIALCVLTLVVWLLFDTFTNRKKRLPASESHLNLDNIPSDIIRMIIKSNPQVLLTIDRLRLISPRWDSQVLDYLNHLKARPVINQFKWHTDKNNEWLTVQIQSKYRSYFGVANWRNWKNWNNFFSDPDEFVSFHYKLDKKKGKQRTVHSFMTRTFERCSQIRSLELNTFDKLMALSYDLPDTMIYTIAVIEPTHFDEEISAQFMKFIREHNIKRLRFAYKVFQWKREKTIFREFLNDATEMVNVIYIKMQYFYESGLSQDQLRTWWQAQLDKLSHGQHFTASVHRVVDEIILIKAHNKSLKTQQGVTFGLFH